ncbi:hypothetical protein HDU81_010982 [Chytriomyces hyalinus]|nr:hypothetical protein HDU81_010982 [Chytriomyces hyalinus]
MKKTRPPSDNDSLDHDESDNAETMLATSDAESEQQLGAALVGGPLKTNENLHFRSSGSFNLQVSNLYNNPKKTAFDVFCKFLEAGQLHVVDADQGLAVAFQSVVLKPVQRMGKLGGKLVTFATDYGPAMFYLSQLFYCIYVEGLTDNLKEHNNRKLQFSNDDLQLFGKRPSVTMMNGFNAFLPCFPHFLELDCFNKAFDESKLAPNVPDSMKLQYILQHASQDVHSLLGRVYGTHCDGQTTQTAYDAAISATNEAADKEDSAKKKESGKCAQRDSEDDNYDEGKETSKIKS